jgi:hypothetical protein
MIEKLKGLIGQSVKRLFIIVWPPSGESEPSQIDMAAGLVFEGNSNEIFSVHTVKDDLNTAAIGIIPLPLKYYLWEEFDTRMNRWMYESDGMEIEKEYYDASLEPMFGSIIGNVVKDVELITIADPNPIGIKLIFENDYLLLTPINDGNTIETTYFNKHDNIRHFKRLGRIEYISLATHNRTSNE